MLAYVRTYGVNASITRGANTYGPNQYPEKLIPLFVTNALDGQPLPVYGDGTPGARLAPRRGSLRRRSSSSLREGAPARSTTSAAATSTRTSRSTHRILEVDGRGPVARPPRRGPRRARPALRARHVEAARRSAGRRSTRFGESGLPQTVDWYREQPRLVGADQVGRVPRVLRAAVRRAPARVASRGTRLRASLRSRSISFRLPWTASERSSSSRDAVAVAEPQAREGEVVARVRLGELAGAPERPRLPARAAAARPGSRPPASARKPCVVQRGRIARPRERPAEAAAAAADVAVTVTSTRRSRLRLGRSVVTCGVAAASVGASIRRRRREPRAPRRRQHGRAEASERPR